MKKLYLLPETLQGFFQRLACEMFIRVLLPLTRQPSQDNNTCFKIIKIQQILFHMFQEQHQLWYGFTCQEKISNIHIQTKDLRRAHPLLVTFWVLFQTPKENITCFLRHIRDICKNSMRENSNTEKNSLYFSIHKITSYGGTNTQSLALPSLTALTAKSNICCASCFIALLPGEPARAISFKTG